VCGDGRQPFAPIENKDRIKFAQRYEPYRKMKDVSQRGYMADDLITDDDKKFEKRLQRFKDGMVVKKKTG